MRARGVARIACMRQQPISSSGLTGRENSLYRYTSLPYTVVCSYDVMFVGLLSPIWYRAPATQTRPPSTCTLVTQCSKTKAAICVNLRSSGHHFILLPPLPLRLAKLYVDLPKAPPRKKKLRSSSPPGQMERPSSNQITPSDSAVSDMTSNASSKTSICSDNDSSDDGDCLCHGYIDTH